MNATTGNGATQSNAELTQRQRQLLSYLSQMTDSAQDFILGAAEYNARAFPRQRPKLRLVAGGSA